MKKILKLLKYLFLTLIVGMILVAGSFIYKNKQHVTHVKKWQTETMAVAKEDNMTEYLDIIQAIILTESKGTKLDLMQSSESRYGETAVIESEEESLQAGISFLKQAITKGNEANVDIWTSVQAYNFGLNYIDFIKDHGGKHTLELAEEYSRDILAPTLGNDNQVTYHYKNPIAYWHNGGYLYKNGGNIFYAEMIKINMRIIDWLG